MEKFIPMRADTMVDVYRNSLLCGDALRIDGGGHDRVDVIPRGDIGSWNARKNVGEGCYARLPRYTDQFRTASERLKEEGYIVKKVACDMSGCCQYHASLYYLA